MDSSSLCPGPGRVELQVTLIHYEDSNQSTGKIFSSNNCDSHLSQHFHQHSRAVHFNSSFRRLSASLHTLSGPCFRSTAHLLQATKSHTQIPKQIWHSLEADLNNNKKKMLAGVIWCSASLAVHWGRLWYQSKCNNGWDCWQCERNRNCHRSFFQKHCVSPSVVVWPPLTSQSASHSCQLCLSLAEAHYSLICLHTPCVLLN